MASAPKANATWSSSCSVHLTVGWGDHWVPHVRRVATAWDLWEHGRCDGPRWCLVVVRVGVVESVLLLQLLLLDSLPLLLLLLAISFGLQRGQEIERQSQRDSKREAVPR
jgi:hypothetical protein